MGADTLETGVIDEIEDDDAAVGATCDKSITAEL